MCALPSLSCCCRALREADCIGLAFIVVPYSSDMNLAVSISAAGYQSW
jgi:hypothetical protein